MFVEPLTAERIPLLRLPNAAMPPPLSDEDMRRDGTFTAEDQVVPGPEGAPDISLLICRPADAKGLTPAICHTRRGMIAGDGRTRMPEMLDGGGLRSHLRRVPAGAGDTAPWTCRGRLRRLGLDGGAR